MIHDIVVIDPPWKFSSNSKAKPGRNARRHYDCMSDVELTALKIPAAKDSLMFMWTTAPMMARSLPVMQAWGFKYVSQIVWVKSRIATGFWVRNRHEICVIGKRGKFPCPKPAPFNDSVITAPTREHSRKPDELQDRIDAVWQSASKIEMFARQTRIGWVQWGNEVCKFDEVDA